MNFPRLPIAILCAIIAAPSLAQMPAAEKPFFSGAIPIDPELAGTVRLTPEQREAALEDGAARAMADPQGGVPADKRIHGEMGVEVGTGGERAVFGTAAVPLGETGVAAFSFESGRDARRKYRARRP